MIFLEYFQSGFGRTSSALRRLFLVGAITPIFFAYPLPAETLPENEPVSADTGERHRFTLEEIIQRGLKVSPQLMTQRYTIDQAEAQFKQSRAGRLPRLECYQIASLVPEARGDAVYSAQDRADIFDNLNPFTRIELTVTQPLYTFGRLKAHMEAAKKGLSAKQAALGRFEQDLIKSLKDLYFSQLLNNELCRLVSDTEEQFSKAVNKAEEMLEENTGTLTQQDLLKLRYGLIRAGGQLVELEKGKRLVHAAMHRLLMLPRDEDFILDEKRLKAVKYELKDLETYRQQALTGRPEKKELEAGLEAKASELKAEQKGYYPDLFLAGKFRYAVAPNRSEQENPFVVEDFNYLDGGVYLGWRLALDFGLPQRIAEKKAEFFALKQKQQEAISGILLEVEKAYQEALEKQKTLGFARKARRNGRALSTLSAASFHLGLGEAKEVFEAFQIYTESAARYYMAIKDYNLAVAELERVAGLNWEVAAP